jgi:hypothetical protein
VEFTGGRVGFSWSLLLTANTVAGAEESTGFAFCLLPFAFCLAAQPRRFHEFEVAERPAGEEPDPAKLAVLPAPAATEADPWLMTMR